MKYIYINRTKILPFTKRMEMIENQRNYMYANEEEKPISLAKELIIEEEPEYDEKTQKLYAYFQDGEVITKKFEIIEK